MAFSIQCSNKGCLKLQEPYIDPKADKVYCSLCDGELSNVTYFVKVQLKQLKQYKQKSAKPFAVKCSKCGKEERPKVVQDDVVCGSCSKSLDNLTPIFKNMLKEKLKTTDKDV